MCSIVVKYIAWSSPHMFAVIMSRREKCAIKIRVKIYLLLLAVLDRCFAGPNSRIERTDAAYVEVWTGRSCEKHDRRPRWPTRRRLTACLRRPRQHRHHDQSPPRPVLTRAILSALPRSRHRGGREFPNDFDALRQPILGTRVRNYISSNRTISAYSAPSRRLYVSASQS